MVGIEIENVNNILDVSTNGVSMGNYNLSCGNITCNNIASSSQSYVMFKSTHSSLLFPNIISLVSSLDTDTSISIWNTIPYKSQGINNVICNGTNFLFGENAVGIYNISYLIPFSGLKLGSRCVYISLNSDKSIQYAKQLVSGNSDGNIISGQENLMVTNNDSFVIKAVQNSQLAIMIGDSGSGSCYVIIMKIS